MHLYHHQDQYNLTNFQIALAPCSMYSWGNRHFQEAKKQVLTQTVKWLHRVIGFIECLPVIGIITAIFERAIAHLGLRLGLITIIKKVEDNFQELTPPVIKKPLQNPQVKKIDPHNKQAMQRFIAICKKKYQKPKLQPKLPIIPEETTEKPQIQPKKSLLSKAFSNINAVTIISYLGIAYYVSLIIEMFKKDEYYEIKSCGQQTLSDTFSLSAYLCE